MKVDNKHYCSIWPAETGRSVYVIDQRWLPHRFEVKELTSIEAVEIAIREMWVRGAPLIGATAAYGMALLALSDPAPARLEEGAAFLKASRPTAVNLAWAVDRMLALLMQKNAASRAAAAWAEAAKIAAEDVAANNTIGVHGATLLHELALRLQRPLNVLTHCNAGWLATVDWGTALAPVYKAHAQGVRLHVWVDETRPRNQGASLTAWELGHEGVPHTVIADNAGGHLMQHGMVDIAIVGCDRVTASGDVCNKIGTYLKALAAHDNGVPFYAAMPFATLDMTLDDGVREIPIEERSAREVTHITGLAADERLVEVRLTPAGSAAANFGFDVTPHRLMTGLITEKGIYPATRKALAAACAKI